MFYSIQYKNGCLGAPDLFHMFTRATSKTWTRTLDQDPEKPGPRKTWTLQTLDPEKSGLRKTWTLKNLDLKNLGPEKPES